MSGELEQRRVAAAAAVRDAGCDGALVYGPQGHTDLARWLTDFEPLMGDVWLLLGADGRLGGVLEFGWQVDEARERSGAPDWRAPGDPGAGVAAAIERLGWRRLATAGAARLPWGAHATLTDPGRGLELVDAAGALDGLRRRKSPAEVERLRAAGWATDRMLDAVRARIRPGMRERDVVAIAVAAAFDVGAEPAFEPLVVSGPARPVPVRRATDRVLEAGDPVMVDLGAAVDGYRGDAARTFVLGRVTPAQQRAWDVVLRAYDATLALARPGVPCAELDRAARAVIEGAGYAMSHRVGHGIGLGTAFEWPDLASDEAPLEPGVAICVEPGLFADGLGNFKLEDDLVVTAGGCELLTSSDSTLEVIG